MRAPDGVQRNEPNEERLLPKDPTLNRESILFDPGEMDCAFRVAGRRS